VHGGDDAQNKDENDRYKWGGLKVEKGSNWADTFQTQNQHTAERRGGRKTRK